MTQIRRPKVGNQKRTLVYVAIAVFCTVLLVIVFLQIDSWPTKHMNHARMIKPPGLTPGVVGTALLESITTKQRNLRRPNEQQNERRPIPVEEESQVEEGDEEASSNEQEGGGETSPEEQQRPLGDNKSLEQPVEQQPGEQQQQQLQGRTFVMELENLKPDVSSASTSGTVVFETRADWAPIGVQHFHDLVDKAHFYDQNRFFRVVNNFVVQFGLAADPQLTNQWKNNILKDDPVITSNAVGTLTYATSGPDTRTTQLFINTNVNGNKFLDSQGFAPFAIITKGLEHVYRINNEYGEKPNQGKIHNQGNVYLQQEFPNLSYINVIRPATPQDLNS